MMFNVKNIASICVIVIAGFSFAGCSSSYQNKDAMSDEEIAYNQSNGSVVVFSSCGDDEDAKEQEAQDGGVVWPDEPSVVVFSWTDEIVPSVDSRGECEKAKQEAEPIKLTPVVQEQDEVKAQPSETHDVVFFAHNSAKLDDKSIKIIDETSMLYKSGEIEFIRISGHASPAADKSITEIQKANVNMSISLKRALMVAKEFEKRGVPLSNMVISAHGANSGVSGAKVESDAASRRVDISYELKSK